MFIACAVVGVVLVSRETLVLHINELFVVESCRRNGIGKTLMEHVIQRLCFVGTSAQSSSLVSSVSNVKPCCLSLRLHVDLTNLAAQALYAKLGFVLDCEVPDYYEDGRGAQRLFLDL